MSKNAFLPKNGKGKSVSHRWTAIGYRKYWWEFWK